MKLVVNYVFGTYSRNLLIYCQFCEFCEKLEYSHKYSHYVKLEKYLNISIRFMSFSVHSVHSTLYF